MGIYFNQVYPTMGAVPAYKCLALIVVGGLGSLPGAVLASMLLGVGETLLIGYANIPLPRDSLAFIAMLESWVRSWPTLVTSWATIRFARRGWMKLFRL